MKKVVIIFILTVVTFVSAVAQISGGLKAGVNFANQKIDVDDVSVSPDSRTGFHVGGYLKIAPTDNFAIQPEILFNSLGAKQDDYKETWNYLSVPVMLVYQPVPVFNVHAGPQLGFLLSAKSEFEGEKEDVEDTKNIDFGIGLGVGVDLPMGLGLSARYYLGLGNVYDFENMQDVEGDPKVTNRSFMISVSYRIFGK